MTERDAAERTIERLMERGWTWRPATAAVLTALDIIGVNEPDPERLEEVAMGALVGGAMR